MGLRKFLKQSGKIMQRAGETLGEGISISSDPRRVRDRIRLAKKVGTFVFDVGAIKKAVTHPSPTTIGLAALEVGAVLPAGKVGKFTLLAGKAGMAARAARAAEEVNIFARPTRAAANRVIRARVAERLAKNAKRLPRWLTPP